MGADRTDAGSARGRAKEIVATVSWTMALSGRPLTPAAEERLVERAIERELADGAGPGSATAPAP